MQIYSSDKISPRSFPWLWYLRLVAIIATFGVLGITAENSATFHDIGCNAPGRLSYNLAVAVVSFIVLIYFILASGPSRATRLLPWFILGQLALDIIMFILWISAAATSSYSCNDLCTACGILDGYVYFDGETCECATIIFKRDYSPRPRNVLQSRGSHANIRRDDSTVGGTIVAKQAVDAFMTALFALFIVADIIWLARSQRSATTTPAPITGPPTKTEEAGMPAGAPTYPGHEYNPNNHQMAPRQDVYAGQNYSAPSPPPQSIPQQQQQPMYTGGQYPPTQQYGQHPYPQPYPSPQGEYPMPYGSSNPQQANYPDGVSEMHSPTEAKKMGENNV